MNIFCYSNVVIFEAMLFVRESAIDIPLEIIHYMLWNMLYIPINTIGDNTLHVMEYVVHTY